MSNYIPIYTTGDIGVKSTTYTPNSNTTYISAYSGDQLSGRP
jgi:hypothetical protein